MKARARLGFAALLKDAPPAEVLEAAIAADPGDLRARHLLGAQRLVAGRSEEALEQFLEMLRGNREFEDGLPRKALIDAFRVIDDAELVLGLRLNVWTSILMFVVAVGAFALQAVVPFRVEVADALVDGLFFGIGWRSVGR